MPRVMPITSAVVAGLLATAPGALAQDTTTNPWRDRVGLPRDTTATTTGTSTGTAAAQTDTAYIRQAIRSNYAEVGLGRLAEKRAENSAVKDFAERMITDHNAMNRQWGELAKRSQMQVGIDFGAEAQQSMERLEDLSGSAFDQAYMSEMIRLHEQDLTSLQRVSSSARSSDVRQLANSGVSTVRTHLSLAQDVGRQVGVASTAGRAGGVTNPLPAPTDSGVGYKGERTTGDDRKVGNNGRALPAKDRAFVDDVLSDHLLHMRLARRAGREGKLKETRELAEQIQEEFTKWGTRWQTFANRRDTNLTSHLERRDRDRIRRLEGAPDQSYDRTYAAIVARHMGFLLEDFQNKGRKAETAGVRRLVDNEMPVIRELLSRARKLEVRTNKVKDDSNQK